MFAAIKRSLCRRKLRDDDFLFMFDDAVDDELVVIDCETTDLDIKKAELLSIAAIKIRQHKILSSQSLQLVVRPDADIEEEAIKVHHLREIDVEHGLSPQHALRQLLQFIGPRPLIGYYLEYDVAIINKYIRPWLGIRLPNKLIEVSSLYYDHIQQQHRAHPYIGNVDLRFDTIMEALSLPKLAAHDAFNDALMTAMMYLSLKQRINN